MKTLKKTLCLVLAMVMVFGLCTISASAKLDSYSDKDAIKYEEAVDVLSGIGILQGSGGAFRPQATITRAEAAKIIAYLVIGDSKQADALKASSDPFTDVSADYWAAGYIAYCASVGIIKGMGDGSYHPLDNVKGLQFATMLLRALGYGKDGEFEGSDWAINASKWALSLKLFEGNLAGASATEDATREECALYAFNTLDLEKVTYSALLGGYTTSAALGGDAANANMQKTFAKDFNLDNTKDSEDYDAFGRVDGYYWYVNKPSNRVTNYYVDGNKLKETFTTAATGADIFNALDLTKSVIEGDNTEFEVYYNSEKKANFVAADDLAEVDEEDEEAGDETVTVEYAEDTKPKAKWEIANIAKGNTTAMFGTGNGVETYVYTWVEEVKDADDITHIRICLVDTYLAKVTDVTKATATEDAKTEVEVASNDLTLEDDTFETDEFKVDDYVLITVADGKIQSMVPAVVKKGEITRYTTSGAKKITADGVEYATAKEQNLANFGWVSAKDIASAQVNKGDYNLYIDNYGYLIGVEAIAGATNYVYVAQFGYKYITGGSLSDDMGLTADVYYADGTNKVLFVDVENSELEYDEDANTTPQEISEALNGAAGGIGIYKISMKDDKAKLTSKGTAVSTEKKLQVGITYVDGTNTADGQTVYFYVTEGSGYKKSGWSVKAYTGVRNIPATGKDDDVKATAVIADDEHIAKAVLVGSVVADETDETVYLYTGDHVSDKASGNKVKVTYMGYNTDGELVEIGSKTYDDAAAAQGAIDGFDDEDDGLVNQFVTVSGGEPKAYEADENAKIKYMSDVKISKVNAKTSITVAKDEEELDPDEFSMYWNTTKVIAVNGTKLDNYTAIEKAVNKDGKIVTASFGYDKTNAVTILVILEVEDAPAPSVGGDKEGGE